MLQQTSKILLVRLTANKTRSYFRYALRVLLVTLCDLTSRSDQNTGNDYFTLSTVTYFDWFPLHTRIEASFGVNFTHGVYQNCARSPGSGVTASCDQRIFDKI